MAQQTKSKSGRGSNGSRARSSTVSSRRSTTVSGAKNAGDAVASRAEQLKAPAIAAGVGLAGLVGGIVIGRSKNKKGFEIPLRRRSIAKGTSKKLSTAAKNIGTVAEQTGEIAERVRLASDAVAGKNGRTATPRRSPVEVLLEGLTRRSLPRA